MLTTKKSTITYFRVFCEDCIETIRTVEVRSKRYGKLLLQDGSEIDSVLWRKSEKEARQAFRVRVENISSNLTIDRVGLAMSAIRAGKKQSDIAEVLNLSHTAISNLVQSIEATVSRVADFYGLDEKPFSEMIKHPIFDQFVEQYKDFWKS